jgi:hypothetical protein
MPLKIYSCILLVGLFFSTLESQKITVTGRAMNAKLGAVVESDKGVYYLDGVSSWDKEFYEKKVKVTGRLVIKGNETKKDDAIAARVIGPIHIIKKPKWTLAE